MDYDKQAELYDKLTKKISQIFCAAIEAQTIEPQREIRSFEKMDHMSQELRAITLYKNDATFNAVVDLTVHSVMKCVEEVLE